MPAMEQRKTGYPEKTMKSRVYNAHRIFCPGVHVPECDNSNKFMTALLINGLMEKPRVSFYQFNFFCLVAEFDFFSWSLI